MGHSHKKIKLLVITQKVDINDDVLGFMHGWIKKLAEKLESIDVICLYKGKYNLPKKVKVLSLGKEESGSRWKYLFRFYKYILRERRNYDAVFVHMNQIYVILGGLFWKSWKKKICLWYNHRYGDWITRIAFKIADSVFYTSPFSFASKFKKARIMPVGIDTDRFKRKQNVKKIKNSTLFLGRVSPVKNLDVLIGAVKIIDKKGINFVLNIVGEVASDKDTSYFKKIKEISRDLKKKGKIRFLGSVPHYKAVEIYSQNEIFVNLTDSGSLDKTILEAMACETLVIVSNKSFCGILPEELIFKEGNEKDLVKKLESAFKWQPEEREIIAQELRDFVVEKHNLDKLVLKIIDLIK